MLYTSPLSSTGTSILDSLCYARRMRLILTILLVILAILLSSSPIHADSGDSCNNFETIQSIILSEATRQPLEAQVEIARVAVTKGACYLDANFYTGYGIAQRIMADRPNDCIASVHCRAYFLLYTIPPETRESAARAAYVALTESPRVPRYHFDSWGSVASWWDSPRACPNGWFIVGLTKVC